MITAEDLDLLLDAPIVIHRVYIKLTGDLQSAAMLAQAVYWSKRLPEERKGWFYKKQTEWETETSLTRRQQERARSILRKFNFWEESLQGIPAQLWFRVDRAKLAAALTSLNVQNSHTEASKNDSTSEDGKLDCTEEPSQHVQNRQTGVDGSDNLGCTKAPDINTKITNKDYSQENTAGESVGRALSAQQHPPALPASRATSSPSKKREDGDKGQTRKGASIEKDAEKKRLIEGLSADPIAQALADVCKLGRIDLLSLARLAELDLTAHVVKDTRADESFVRLFRDWKCTQRKVPAMHLPMSYVREDWTSFVDVWNTDQRSLQMEVQAWKRTNEMMRDIYRESAA